MRLARTTTAAAVAGLLLTVPLAASAAAPAKVPGRTLVVSIYGLTTQTSGKVVVKGPNNYRTVMKGAGERRLSGLAPGTYQLTAKPVRVSGTKAKAKPGTRTVSVKAGKGARVQFVYAIPGTS